MKTFKQLLSEVFDLSQAFDWHWIKQDPGEYRAEFDTEEHQYQVRIADYGSDLGWIIEFATKKDDPSEETGENVASKIMATVITIVEEFVALERPNKMFIDAEKNKLGRADFYEKVLKRVLPSNYSIEKEESSDYVDIYITKEK